MGAAPPPQTGRARRPYGYLNATVWHITPRVTEQRSLLPRYEVITIGDAEIGTTTIDAEREYREGDTIRIGRQTWVVDRVEPNVYGGLPRLICVRPTKG